MLSVTQPLVSKHSTILVVVDGKGVEHEYLSHQYLIFLMLAQSLACSRLEINHSNVAGVILASSIRAKGFRLCSEVVLQFRYIPIGDPLGMRALTLLW
jgi:hypothetical protein